MSRMNAEGERSSKVFSLGRVTQGSGNAIIRSAQDSDVKQFKHKLEILRPALQNLHEIQISFNLKNLITVDEILSAFQTASLFILHESMSFVMPQGLLSFLAQAKDEGYTYMVLAEGKLTSETQRQRVTFDDVLLPCKLENNKLMVWHSSILTSPIDLSKKRKKPVKSFDSETDNEQTDVDETIDPATSLTDLQYLSFDVSEFVVKTLDLNDIRYQIFKTLASLPHTDCSNWEFFQYAMALATSYCCPENRNLRKSGYYYSIKAIARKPPLLFIMRFPSSIEWLTVIQHRHLDAAKMANPNPSSHVKTHSTRKSKNVPAIVETTQSDLLYAGAIMTYSKVVSVEDYKNDLNMEASIFGPDMLLIEQLTKIPLDEIFKKNPEIVSYFESFESVDKFVQRMVQVKKVTSALSKICKKDQKAFITAMIFLTRVFEVCYDATNDTERLIQDSLDQCLATGNEFEYMRREIPRDTMQQIFIDGTFSTCFLPTKGSKMLKSIEHLITGTPYIGYKDDNLYYVYLRTASNQLYEYSFYPFKPNYVSLCAGLTSSPSITIHNDTTYFTFMKKLMEGANTFCNTNWIHEWILSLIKCTLPIFYQAAFHNFHKNQKNDDIDCYAIANFLSTADTTDMNWLSTNTDVQKTADAQIQNTLVLNCLRVILDENEYGDFNIITLGENEYNEVQIRVHMYLMTRNLIIFGRTNIHTNMETEFQTTFT